MNRRLLGISAPLGRHVCNFGAHGVQRECRGGMLPSLNTQLACCKDSREVDCSRLRLSCNQLVCVGLSRYLLSSVGYLHSSHLCTVTACRLLIRVAWWCWDGTVPASTPHLIELPLMNRRDLRRGQLCRAVDWRPGAMHVVSNIPRCLGQAMKPLPKLQE